MSVEWKHDVGPPDPVGPWRARRIAPGSVYDAGLTADLLSPHLYDLVVWGFTERNNSGQWVLRRDIQDRLDGHVVGDHGAPESEESPLYVGFRCQPCWEAAVTLVAYSRHLCPQDGSDA